MIKRSAGIGTILLIGLVVQTAAQLLPVENFNVNSGLSQSQVTSITQDIRNYLWIGTAAGLNRFDGVHFTTFSKKDGINSNSITALYCSHKGDIWIGTTKGLSKYDGYRFENLQTPEENQFVSFDAIAEDASGNIYAYSSWQGIFIVKGGKVMRMNTPEKNKTPTCIYSNSKNQLWVYINGAGFYTLLNERWTKKPDISGLQKHEFIRQMVEGKDSYYAITNQRDLLKIRDGQVVQRKKNTGFFLNACVDDGTNLWVASSKGIIVLDGNDLSFKKEINARNGLSDNLIHTIYKDADNNFWIGADGDGLFKYCGGPFVRYDKNTGLAGNIVMGFSKTADGNILLGTREGGLQLFDYQKKTFRSIHYRSHSTYGINCMGSDGRGTVYIGTMDNRLLKINGEQVSELSLEKKYRPGIYTIKSYGHRILVHTTMGGYWIDGATVTKMQGVTGLVNSIELNAEEILMAGDNGIYAYSLRKNNFKKLYIQGIADDINISCFARLNNYIVIGSFGEGLFFWDPVANRVLSCNRDDGLKDNNVFALMKDTAGNLWVGTSSGMQLVRLDDQQKSFYVKQFNIGDGYEPSETNLNAMLEDSEHNVWVGTTKGVFIYHSFPEKEHSLRPPVVVLESVDYPGFKTATQGSFSAWEHLPVDPQIAFANNSISFNFKGICLRDPASLLYSYQLEGYDAGFSPLRSETTLNYKNLPPGQYTFKVK
ncbi:MAG: histidine kinase, partial [Niabella sp.]|nr:histidine kinase [Niabella sp.]